MERIHKSMVHRKVVYEGIVYILFIIFSISNVCSQEQNREPFTYTPNGSIVSLTNRGELLTASEKAAIKAEWTKTYPKAFCCGEATTTYNCHAYAWSVSEGGNKYWMNSPNDDLYWQDGSYIQTNSSDPKATKVSYASDDHSAIVSIHDYYFVSKWGVLCLMRHTPADCPYNSKNLKYYKLSMEICGDQIVTLPSISSKVSRKYYLSNVPAGANVEWSVSGAYASIINGQGSDTIQVSIGRENTIISAEVTCSTGLIVRIPFNLIITASSAPIITDITLTNYGSRSILAVETNQPDGIFVWSTSDDNVTLYDNPFPDDASFIATPNIFKAVRVKSPGYYTITVTGISANLLDEYT